MRFTRLLLICTAMVLSCATESSYKWPRQYHNSTATKTACYQIQDHGTTIGYAHQYQWELNDGSSARYYLMYDPLSQMVGYMGSDGHTEKYLPNGKTKVLGIFSLESAAARILDAEHSVQLYLVRAEDVPYVSEAEKDKTAKAALEERNKLDNMKNKPPATAHETSETSDTTSQPETKPASGEEEEEGVAEIK